MMLDVRIQCRYSGRFVGLKFSGTAHTCFGEIQLHDKLVDSSLTQEPFIGHGW